MRLAWARKQDPVLVRGKSILLGMVVGIMEHIYNPHTRELRQENCCDFEVSILS